MKQVEGCIFNLDDVLVDSSDCHILPGVKRFLINLRVSGMKLAITTTDKNANFILQKLGIEKFFDTIQYSNNSDLESTLLKTAEFLNLNPENCVIFCKEGITLKEAKKINMPVIGVGFDSTNGIPDKLIPNLSNVNSSILNFAS